MKLVFVPLKDVFKECKGKRQFSIKKDAYRRFSSVSNEMQIGIKKIAALQMISSLCGIFTPIMMWWCPLAAVMFLLVMSPLLCRTTLVQCQFLLPFIVRKAKTWGITSPAQPQMRATRFSPIPRRFHQRRASAYS